SAQNRLHGAVASVTPLGNLFRVALTTPQPLAAEVTEAAFDRLPLRVGDRVDACWKETATRLLAIWRAPKQVCPAPERGNPAASWEASLPASRGRSPQPGRGP